jgi:hypothetical protein
VGITVNTNANHATTACKQSIIRMTLSSRYQKTASTWLHTGTHQCAYDCLTVTSLTSRACWRAAQHQPLRLCQRDVAAVREGSDAQAAAVADVLVVVRNLGVADVDLAVLGLLIDQVPQLALPLEAGAALHTLVDEALDHVTRVHVDGAQGDELLAVQLAQVAVDELDQPNQLLHL